MKSLRTFPHFFAGLAMAFWAATASFAAIQGLPPGPGNTYVLVAREGHIITPDGNSLLVWGLGLNTQAMQYPAPTLIINQGQTINVVLVNQLTIPTSLVFPAMGKVRTSDLLLGQAGQVTREARPGGAVRYTFTASQPGTYHYHSGTDPELQVSMGLIGAIIVRPTGFNPVTSRRAYATSDSRFDDEFLFLLTEMDPRINRQVELGQISSVDTTTYFPVQWYINGRCGPDTMFPPNLGSLPNQPYNCFPVMHPGERILMRVIGGGRDPHPFHHHGNHARIIASDGVPWQESGSTSLNLSQEVFTIPSVPGQTIDALFEWTGAHLGWDAYGHAAGDPLAPGEYAPDHGKPFPVISAQNVEMAIGAFWNGTPFLGGPTDLPPGQGGFNPDSGYTFMWHSHTEKEITNNDVFPGGMMTMLLVLPPGAPKP